MFNKGRKNPIVLKFILLIAFFGFLLLNPIIIGNLKVNSSFNKKESTFDKEFLNTNQYSKENYSEILTSERYGYGNITLDNLRIRRNLLGFTHNNNTYPLLEEDYWYDPQPNLNISKKSLKFKEVKNVAIRDNLDKTIKNTNKFRVILNESLKVWFNNSIHGYLIYHSRYTPTVLKEFWIDNGTAITKLKEKRDYEIDHDDFLVFNYHEYFPKKVYNSDFYNFTMYLLWQYNLTLTDWEIGQYRDKSLIMKENQETFNASFYYRFKIEGSRFEGPTYFLFTEFIVDVDYMDVALTINLPDKESLNNLELELNNKTVNVNNYLNPDNSINIRISNRFTTNSSEFLLNFTCSYDLKFKEAVGKSWAVDRLIVKNYIRELIYFPSLVSGPQHIYLKGVTFYEPAANFDQVISNKSLFKRQVTYIDANETVMGKKGIYIFIPYLIAGETCPFSIKYKANQLLKLMITDNIKMPLVGARIELYYYGLMYGTYVSNKQIYPISPGNTNENGNLIIKNVPRGNYSVRIFYKGNFIQDTVVSTDNDMNYVYTTVPHFPLWILIFGSINGIIIVIGALFYIKNKKFR
ncbi:MAG: hypothetical protein ACFFEN_01560 [Candidatus Thorarchaeota archaeon]